MINDETIVQPQEFTVEQIFNNNEYVIPIYQRNYAWSRFEIEQFVNVNIRMYNFDDVQCTVIPPVAYGFVTGMNLQLC